MALIVADTDVLIDALRGREPIASQVIGALEANQLVTTAITAFELWSGATSPRAREEVAALLAPVGLLPVDHAAARAAAEILLALRGEGQSIGMADSLIAGICVARGASLFARNAKHFGRVPRLVLVAHGR